MVALFPGGQNMNDWQSTYLGRGALPRDLSGFEIEAFFSLQRRGGLNVLYSPVRQVTPVTRLHSLEGEKPQF